MAETDTLTFNGVQAIESQERVDEYKSGVPARGAPATLFTAPIIRTAKVGAVNMGQYPCTLRMKHQGSVKTVTSELLAAFSVSSTVFIGQLEHGNIVPGTVSITNAGSPATL